MIKNAVATPRDASGSPAKAWLRALELTAPIIANRDRVLSTVVAEVAARSGNSPALLSDCECLTYQALLERSNRYARWALDQQIAKGEVVCLLMTNRPEYFAIWLGITSVGVVVALLNSNLIGPSLAHCINIVSPRHLIAAADLADSLCTALPHVTVAPTVWIHGAGESSFPRLDVEIEQYPGVAPSGVTGRLPTIEDRALYIYTSGTTGLPKAVNVSHARVMQWSHWFAGMMGMGTTDRMYTCLPMYHSVGGVVAPGATLVAGGAAVLRDRFSASRFWSDVIRWDCTMFQYIGELCRYLLHAAPTAGEKEHRIKLACGNGLAAEVWEEFQSRFRIPRVFEFYAATEGGVSLFNIEGKPGAIGHVPAYLSHRFSPALVRFDFDKGEPFRDERGFCVRCSRNETGEAIGKVVDDPSAIGSRFEGYTSREASEQRVLRHVFEPGDRWVRTGDLMRKDAHGFFYFIDRIGDTFRWKGENVATSEVAEALCAFPGVRHANVYGVAIPGADGRAGMAALVTGQELDVSALRKHLISRLPRYARPLFLRLLDDIEVTGTFKYSKIGLVREGYDPAAVNDMIYFDNPESNGFARLDDALYNRIQRGEIVL
jgi:fatty-acyl-CoA synthase